MKGGGDSQSRSIIFPKSPPKFLEKFCCPLFLSIVLFFNLFLFFPDRFQTVGGFGCFSTQHDSLTGQRGFLFPSFYK